VIEHDDEPVPGLPARLPDAERVLWQGEPGWGALAVHAFHARKVALYFGALIAWHVVEDARRGQDLRELLTGSAWLGFLGLLVVGMLIVLAYLSARATLYTITDRRVVLRHGVALSLSVNVPFSAVDSANLRKFRDGSGELMLTLHRGERFGYLLNWPHVRPWRYTRPQPALRGLADPQNAAEVLSTAWRAATSSVNIPARMADRPTRTPDTSGLAPLGSPA
jgi:hypothetical protein